MSISQRYEIGVGGKFEWNISDLRLGKSLQSFDINTPGHLLDRLDSRNALDHIFGFSVVNIGAAADAEFLANRQ